MEVFPRPKYIGAGAPDIDNGEFYAEDSARKWVYVGRSDVRDEDIGRVSRTDTFRLKYVFNPLAVDPAKQ